MAKVSPRKQSIGRGALWNLAGTVVALSVAILILAPLTRYLGVERFGVLMLIWAAVGYFGFLDFGLGRALTREVAETLSRPGGGNLTPLVVTGVSALMILGVVVGAGVAAGSSFLTQEVFSLSDAVQPEAERAILLASLAIPAIFIAGGLRGVLEAHRRFATVSIFRSGVMTLIGLATVIVAYLRADLVGVVAIIASVRWIEAVIYWRLCGKELGGFFRPARPALLKSMFVQGGWMTISNIVGPVMVYFDRFVIASLMSAAAVAYYVVPHEVVTKLWVVPGALVAALFPVFSGAASTDPDRVSMLMVRAMKICYFVVGPLVVLAIGGAVPALTFWLGHEFADKGAIVLQILAVGVFVNCLSQILFTLLQGVGRSDITAKLHLVEVVPYIALLMLCVEEFGIKGAAIAWTLRVVIDAVALWVIAGRFFPAARKGLLDTAGWVALAGCAFAVISVLQGTGTSLVGAMLGALVFSVMAWRLVLSRGDRSAVVVLFR